MKLPFTGAQLAKGLAVVVIAGVAVGLLWTSGWIPSRSTYGTIYVDSPEIYTRERLVNDRFLQHAWLMSLLGDTEQARSGRRLIEERRRIEAELAATAGAQGAPAADPAASATGAPQSAAEPPASAATQGASRDLLRVQLAYRDDLRALLIENQLDDRHDLHGNSLYHLKFDATVVPGWNTQAIARVTVRVRPPGTTAADPGGQAGAGLAGGAKSRGVYMDWIESLEARLNKTHTTLKQTFHGNAFLHNDYARLIGFLKANLGAQANPAGCTLEMLKQLATARALLPLPPEGHDQRKGCIAALVLQRARQKLGSRQARAGAERSDEDPRYIGASDLAQLPAPVAPGAAPAGVLAVELDGLADRILDYWLNVFFASKTVQLVLGVRVPESTFIEYDYFNVEALQPLMKLSFFNPSLGSEDAAGGKRLDAPSIFKVLPRDFQITAIDGTVTEKSFEEARLLPGGPALRAFTDFRVESEKWKAAGRPDVKLKVSASDLELLEGDTSSLEAASFTPVNGVAGFYSATAQDGLWHFIQRARAHSRAFTYAVSPKEAADVTVVEQATHSEVGGTATQGGGSGRLETDDELALSAENRAPVVVGFGNATERPDEAEFGWLIGPRESRLEGRHAVTFHGPAQHSLSALVSVPSWWSEVSLEVTTDWVEADGSPTAGGNPKTMDVDLPIDFEPLERALLDVQQAGPEVLELGLDPVRLVACREGSVVIPGERLWRSTVVTVGAQRADEIFVLPDMKGIAARFTSVQNQATPDELRGPDRNIERAVRIWTSEGSATLSAPATIAIPESCSAVVGGPAAGRNAQP